MGSAEGHEGRHIEGAHPDDLDGRIGRLEAKLAAVLVVERRLRGEAGTLQQRLQLGEDTALWNSQDQTLIGRERCVLRYGIGHANWFSEASLQAKASCADVDGKTANVQGRPAVSPHGQSQGSVLVNWPRGRGPGLAQVPQMGLDGRDAKPERLPT